MAWQGKSLACQVKLPCQHIILSANTQTLAALKGTLSEDNCIRQTVCSVGPGGEAATPTGVLWKTPPPKLWMPDTHHSDSLNSDRCAWVVNVCVHTAVALFEEPWRGITAPPSTPTPQTCFLFRKFTLGTNEWKTFAFLNTSSVFPHYLPS